MSFTILFLPPPNSENDKLKRLIEAAVNGVDVRLVPSRETALAELPEARAAYGRLDPELLDAATNLEWLCAPQAGPDPSFYFQELVDSKVVVTNMRGIYNDHIAAHIMSFVLAFARGLHIHLPDQFRGVWNSRGEQASAIYLPDATAVIIGVGGIGGETARHCAYFGMHVIGIDPRVTEPVDGVAELFHPDQLDEHIGRADFVIMTAPQTPRMERMMNLERMRRMKGKAVLINIGRGSNLVIDDLAEALESGIIGGAALDVFETEPLPPTHRLWKAPNFLMTPHVAAAGGFLKERRYALITENCRRFAQGEELKNIVDKANWF